MKGPLTGLIGLAEVVASELEGPLQKDVKMIEQQAQLQAMVGDLLAIARPSAGAQLGARDGRSLALLVSLANAYAASARNAGAQIATRWSRAVRHAAP